MTDEDFLKYLMVDPSNDFRRLGYADWLEERGDRRHEVLRLDPALVAIRDESDPTPDADALARRRKLAEGLDPDWLAFVETLGVPFAPWHFYNRVGNRRASESAESPFMDGVGTRGRLVCFAGDFRSAADWDEGLAADLGALTRLELGSCHYGSGEYRMFPFACALRSSRAEVTGADVIASLRPRSFRPHDPRSLDAVEIPYPGYRPAGGDGRHQDEIHTEFEAQNLFEHEDDDNEREVAPTEGLHGALRRLVAGNRLWYVLLHTPARRLVEGDDFLASPNVVLLAVGRSEVGRRLIGVITQQNCHNLCD